MEPKVTGVNSSIPLWFWNPPERKEWNVFLNKKYHSNMKNIKWIWNCGDRYPEFLRKQPSEKTGWAVPFDWSFWFWRQHQMDKVGNSGSKNLSTSNHIYEMRIWWPTCKLVRINAYNTYSNNQNKANPLSNRIKASINDVFAGLMIFHFSKMVHMSRPHSKNIGAQSGRHLNINPMPISLSARIITINTTP